MAPQNVLVELFADFIRLRQVGYAPEKAWQALRPRISALSEQDVTRLRTLLRGWEAREGRHYQVQGALQATPEHPDERVERVRTSLSEASESAESGEPAIDQGVQGPLTIPVEPDKSFEQTPEDNYKRKRHLIRRISGGQPPSTPPEVSVCPVCQQPNRHGEVYCIHCGNLLVEVGQDGPRPGQTMPLSSGAIQGTYFEDGMVIQIRVRGGAEPIEIVPNEETDTVLGRTSSDSIVTPDVDLTPYSAQSYGVSRLHAALRRRGNTVVLSDMGSLNYTFLNGQRLHTHEQRILTDGDEIRLGHLMMQVFFRRRD